MRHSIRFKLTLMMLALTGGVILALILLNTTFLGKFYYKTKQSTMKNVYYQINQLYGEHIRHRMKRHLTISNLNLKRYVAKTMSTYR